MEPVSSHRSFPTRRHSSVPQLILTRSSKGSSGFVLGCAGRWGCPISPTPTDDCPAHAPLNTPAGRQPPRGSNVSPNLCRVARAITHKPPRAFSRPTIPCAWEPARLSPDFPPRVPPPTRDNRPRNHKITLCVRRRTVPRMPRTPIRTVLPRP